MIVVIGGSGKGMKTLTGRGHEAVAASPNKGWNP